MAMLNNQRVFAAFMPDQEENHLQIGYHSDQQVAKTDPHKKGQEAKGKSNI